MKILRGFLSIIAALVVLLGTGEATTALHIGPSLVAFILAGGSVLGVIGISPLKFSVQTAKVFTELSLFSTAGMASFGGYTAAHSTWTAAHPALVHLVHALGSIGVALGIAGSTPSLESGSPSPAPVPLPAPIPPPDPPKAA